MAERKAEINIQISDMNSRKQKPAVSTQPIENAAGKSGRITYERILIIFESTAFFIILGVFIASLANHKLHHSTMWDTEIWKWCLLIMSILCGRLMAFLLTEAAMFFIWRSNWVDEKVLYFAYGVKKSVVVFTWGSLVTVTWVLLFHCGVKRSKHDRKIEHFVTKSLVGCVIGAGIWMVKNLLVSGVGSVHAKKLFNKIKYIIAFRTTLLDVSKGVHVENASEYSQKDILRELIASIRGQRLHSFAYHHSDMCREISNPIEARQAADILFVNLGGKHIEEDDEDEGMATNKPKCYLNLEDLLKYVKDEKLRKRFEEEAEVKKIGAIINDSNTKVEKHVKRSVFRQWLVDMYKEYDSLNNTLVHSKMATEDLDKIASVVAMFVIIVVWLLFMDYLTIKALVFLSSQFVLLGFIFGNTMKTLFEAVIFVFFIHPFDVGDRCVVDKVEMVVDEMRILSTKFLKFDGEKIYYPNSILFSKPISNLYRSPPMSDSFQFAIHLSTPPDVLEHLRHRITRYLLSNPRRWKEDHSLLFTEIEDVNKMKVTLCFGHTINFHYSGKRAKRRSLLVLEMKKILEDLQIEYHLLPQQVHLKYI